MRSKRPGRMLDAYSAFHNHSFGNASLAPEQSSPQALNTYRGWLERKRRVLREERRYHPVHADAVQTKEGRPQQRGTSGLSKLRAAFVTAAPRDSTAKPTGQRLMSSYLDYEPNHP